MKKKICFSCGEEIREGWEYEINATNYCEDCYKKEKRYAKVYGRPRTLGLILCFSLMLWCVDLADGITQCTGEGGDEGDEMYNCMDLGSKTWACRKEGSMEVETALDFTGGY